MRISTLRTYLFSILFLFLIVSGEPFFAQQTNSSISGDSIALRGHSPQRASYYSMVIPGLGQIYNKKYWKVPVIYAGFGTLAYLVKLNGTKFTKYINAYGDFIDNDTLTTSYLTIINERGLDEREIVKELYENEETYDPSKYDWFKNALELNKDYFRRNRDLSYIGIGLWYILNIVDASVDAHLFDYDISDELTLHIEPELFPTSRYTHTMGIKFSFRF
ncbi:hypothetical protein ES705_03792 [subsurface metagenome]